MARCKTCGTVFHACSSCGLVDWQWDYCDEDCRRNSPVLKEAGLKRAFSFFTKTQLEEAADFLEEYHYDNVSLKEITDFIPHIGNDSLLEKELKDGDYEIYDLQQYIWNELEKFELKV